MVFFWKSYNLEYGFYEASNVFTCYCDELNKSDLIIGTLEWMMEYFVCILAINFMACMIHVLVPGKPCNDLFLLRHDN